MPWSELSRARSAASGPVGDARRLARRAWQLPLGVHAIVLASVLCVVALVLYPGDTFTADEGAYAIQVRALERDGWEYDDRTTAHGAEESWFPLRNAAQEDGRWFAYVDHPAYPLMLLAATRLAGEVLGLHAWGLLGVLGVAATAWLVAAQVDARASRGSFWLAAAAPVAVNGQLVLAHAPSAALAGTAMLAAHRARRTSSWSWTVALLASVAASALLRSESVLFGAALAAAIAIVPAGGTTARPSAADRLRLPAAIAATVAATVVAEDLWIESILGGSFDDGGVRGEEVARTVASPGGLLDFVNGRLEGVWHSLLQGSNLGATGSLLVVVALAMVGFAGWAAARQRPGWRRDVCAALAAAGVLYSARLVMATDQSITGFLAAWPLAVLGLILGLTLGDVRRAALLALTVAFFTGAVVATQYRYGGGFEWGGRFFSPAVVPLAVLTCLGLQALLGALADRRTAVTALVVILAAVPLATGLAVVRNVRPLLGDVVDDVEASGASLVVTHSPALPPAAWRTYPDVAWLVVPRSAMAAAIERIRHTSGARVDVVLYRTRAADLQTAFPGLQDVTGSGTARLGWRQLTLPPPP